MEKKIVIAHRGASGYVPEHTLAAKTMAFAMGADYLEQDIAITKDDRAVVIHDCYLDTVTNVKEIYPHRHRQDGRFYVIDFTLAEIRSLRVHERVSEYNWEVVFKNRFPLMSASQSHLDFKVPTLEEELELIQGLNKSMGKDIGIYPEFKAPRFHQAEGKDIARIVLDILDAYGYTSKKSNCFLQCFDPDTLLRIKYDFNSKLKLIQLIAPNEWKETPGVDYERMLTPTGLRHIATYADGIGPWMNQIVMDKGKGKQPVITHLVEEAHTAGLLVHPYTLRADELPGYVKDFDNLLHVFYVQLQVDGLFTDFPDRAVVFLHNNF